ncbi:MAG: hypothetical protein ACXWZS_09630 [Gemmatirosa sp.]
MTTIRRATGALTTAALLLGGSACNDFLQVDNPNVIDINAIDPVADASTLAGSAQQNFAAAYGWLIMYSSWFSGETLVAETFPTRNEFGQRQVPNTNGSLSTDVWQPLSLAAASTKILLDLELPNPTTNINYARASLWRGYSFVFMAEHFCQGTVESGPALTTIAMLDSAVANFTNAITVGRANASAEAVALANTALVGRARAHLQAGRKAQAAADADAVPAGFVFNLPFIDDLGNRVRLSNRLWAFTFDRGSISVAPAFRVTDPRVTFLAPGTHSLTPQDPASGALYVQQKYPSFAAPIRVASKLEADYIKAEATGTPTEQIAFINARRTANNQPVYAGAADANSVLTELMTQRGYDFFLEGKRLGDFRRNPTNVLGVPQPGAVYFKPGFAPIGTQTCYVLPLQETDNNPNFRTGS